MTRPLFRFNLTNPCLIARTSLWIARHRRFSTTVSFVLFLVAFGLLLAR